MTIVRDQNNELSRGYYPYPLPWRIWFKYKLDVLAINFFDGLMDVTYIEFKVRKPKP
jgi:hypothetical protein